MEDLAFGPSNNFYWSPVLCGQLSVSKGLIKEGKGGLT